jgi:hypothetical protein
MDHLLRKGKHAEGISSVSPTNSWPGYQALKKTSIVVRSYIFIFYGTAGALTFSAIPEMLNIILVYGRIP